MNLVTLVAIHLMALSDPTLVLDGFDPIELAKGRQVPGSPSLMASYGSHAYRFASATNRAAFLANPVAHAVQTGGACGKMGALTGRGAPNRWAVVEGKIFLFASEGCRTSFLANAPQYLQPIPVPKRGDVASVARAKALLSQARLAHGIGSHRPPGSFSWAFATKYTEAGVEKIWWEKAGFFGHARMAVWSESDRASYFNVVDGGRRFEGSPSGVYPLHPAEAREVRATVIRSPMGILLSPHDQAIRSDSPHTFVMVDGDIATEVMLDPKSRRISGIRYTDRHSGPVAHVERRFSDFRSHRGFWVPMASETRVGSQPWGPPRSMASFAIDPPAPDFFGPPASR